MATNTKQIKDFINNLLIELEQCRDEGKDVSQFYTKVEELKNLKNFFEVEKEGLKIIEELKNIPTRKDYPYIEPSDLNEIKSQKTGCPVFIKNTKLTKQELFNKIYGAWLGRCIGCLLGKPFEGWTKEKIVSFLKDTNNYPIKNYASSNIPEKIKKQYKINEKSAWINNVNCFPEDDDINYTLINLKVFETYGENFTSVDIMNSWLYNLPFYHLYTAERVAYKNFINNILPPQSAYYRNPFREWIGAQIRADFWGYVCLGNPEKAAEFAFRDASVSHIKNGIYSAMFVASVISVSAFTSDLNEIIAVGLSQIPQKSRIYEKINHVLEWKKEAISYTQVIQRIHNLYNETNLHHWCHTIPNTMIVVTALIYGETDFEKSIGIAVEAGFDTDCNAATVGSIIGMIIGARKINPKWYSTLNNTIESAVYGFSKIKISEAALRTINCIKLCNPEI